MYKLAQPLGLDTSRTITRMVAICLSLFGLQLAFTQVALASEPCDPPNIIPQPICDFDDFHGEPSHQIPNGFSPFVIYGDPSFMNDSHSFFGSGTLRIMSNNGSPLKAGIFTQVNVTPGAGYRASVVWAAPNAPTDAWGRQMGIDPTGGTDPNSSNVIWGPIHYGDGRITNRPPGEGPNLDVKARAVNGTITVFFLADLVRNEGANLIYVDVIALYPDESAPAATAPVEPTATDTPPLAVDANAGVSAASAIKAAPAAPQPSLQQFVGTIEPPTPAASDTPPPTATDTPTLIPSDTSTPLPTNTAPPTATWTPWPTIEPISAISLVGAQTQLLGLVSSSPNRALPLLSSLGLLGAVVLGGSLLWLRRK